MAPGDIPPPSLQMVPDMPAPNRSEEVVGTHTIVNGHVMGTRDLSAGVTVVPPLATQLVVPPAWREENNQILAAFIKSALNSLPESTDITFTLLNFPPQNCHRTRALVQKTHWLVLVELVVLRLVILTVIRIRKRQGSGVHPYPPPTPTYPYPLQVKSLTIERSYLKKPMNCSVRN